VHRVYLPRNQTKKYMKKEKLIEWTRARLAEDGITNQHYILSLQGPTVVFLKGVKIKDLDVRVDLIKAGVKLIGGY